MKLGRLTQTGRGIFHSTEHGIHKLQYVNWGAWLGGDNQSLDMDGDQQVLSNHVASEFLLGLFSHDYHYILLGFHN